MLHLPVIHVPSIVAAALALAKPRLLLTSQRDGLERHARLVAVYASFIDDTDPAAIPGALADVAYWTQLEVTRAGIRRCAVTRALGAARARRVVSTGSAQWVRTTELAALAGGSTKLIECDLDTELRGGAASRGVRVVDAHAWLRARGYPLPRLDLAVSSPSLPPRARTVDVACAHP